jgi:hypothetical protein
MKQDTDSKTPDLIEAIAVGGSYVVDAWGKPVRDDANSTALTNNNAQVADAAPGAPAELNAAGGGVPPASAEASDAKAGKR